MTWEYLVTEYERGAEGWHEGVQALLTAFGRDRWELVERVGNTFIFKRSVAEV